MARKNIEGSYLKICPYCRIPVILVTRTKEKETAIVAHLIERKCHYTSNSNARIDYDIDQLWINNVLVRLNFRDTQLRCQCGQPLFVNIPVPYCFAVRRAKQVEEEHSWLNKLGCAVTTASQ